MNTHNMFATWQLVILSFAYIGLLFAIAHLGDKNRQKLSLQWQRIIYPLTLGVYCTSWSFLGTASQTSNNIFSHLPIYLGPILLFLLAWPFIQRLIRISLKLNLTSIADLLASRFGKSSKLAVLVTVVALIGTMPYIALQIKAIVYSFAQLQNTQVASTSEIGFVVSLVLAAFTILFGIRTLDVTERHPGVMLAIAFESLVKLIALLAVGLFVCYGLFDSPSALWQQTKQQTEFTQLTQFDAQYFIAMTIIVMAAFLTLPRQFQVMVVEVKNIKATKWSRYSFPLYVAIFAVLAIPLGLAGKLLLNNQVPSDAYVLHLPWYGEQAWLTLLAFIGAISAASSMVIISAMALSTMLSNEVFFPLLFHRLKQHTSFNKFKFHLLAIRKMLATGVILLSYGVFLLASPDTLASLGQVAFGAMAQLAPALVLAFMWRKASLTGVYSGILVGFCLWLLISLLPQFDINIFGFVGLSSTALTLMSLALNTSVIFVFSLLSRQSVQERMQLALFLEKPILAPHQSTLLKKISAKELQLLVARFVGDKVAEQSFQRFNQEHDSQTLSLTELKQALLTHTEKTLAKVMGASSARLVLSSALEGRDLALDELATLMTEASSQKQAFSHSLLQHAIENASEGISVIDADLKLVAWNKKYIELFQYPEDLVYVGCPVELLIKYNAERGLCGPGDVTQQVSKRLAYLQQGSPHNSERVQPDGTVIRIQGNPLPNGGFVMLFSDITMYHQAEQVLKQANQDLETRVTQRTQALEQANHELAQAHQQAERAHQNKSLYLKACSHDLVQPLEAAKLFSTALVEDKSLTVEQLEKVLHINQSLLIANDMLASLGELARIESGQMTANLKPVSIERLFASLKQEFNAIAKQQQVQLRFVRSSKWILSDAHLVHRILQNLISNAIRYASPGKILVGIKKQQGKLALQVLDNGPGIPLDKQQTVFEQFTRLNNHTNSQAKGLGLGLSISQSFAKLLDHQLKLHSIEGKGSCFSLLANACAEPKLAVNNTKSQDILAGVTVLCVDNEAAILSGMQALLTTWQCQVLNATTPEQAKQICQQQGDEIDIILMDFQLDSDINGVELTQQLRAQLNRELPAILITANCEQAVLDLAKANNMPMLKKMIKPAQLRALMSAKLTAVLQQNYLS